MRYEVLTKLLRESFLSAKSTSTKPANEGLYKLDSFKEELQQKCTRETIQLQEIKETELMDEFFNVKNKPTCLHQST